MSNWGESSPGPTLPDHEATGLEEFLGELMQLDGVLMAALLDRSGRVLADAGFVGEVLDEIAPLAAAVHASGARLGEAAGDHGFPSSLIQAKERAVLVTPLPVRAGIPLVLLVVAKRAQMAGMGRRLEEISGVSLSEVSGMTGLDDPEAFEASLLECLDQLFPREVGH